MGVNWTRDQRQVIESRHRNLLVSAAAGSGKTAVLVERIIEMITDKEHPGDIERLLVMTFTKAAASEMRERILDAIEKKLAKEPDNEYDKEAIKVIYEGLGKVGYVANSSYTVIGEAMSAGRLYDKIGDIAYAKVVLVTQRGTICKKSLKNEAEKKPEEKNKDNI